MTSLARSTLVCCSQEEKIGFWATTSGCGDGEGQWQKEHCLKSELTVSKQENEFTTLEVHDVLNVSLSPTSTRNSHLLQKGIMLQQKEWIILELASRDTERPESSVDQFQLGFTALRGHSCLDYKDKQEKEFKCSAEFLP